MIGIMLPVLLMVGIACMSTSQQGSGNEPTTSRQGSGTETTESRNVQGFDQAHVSGLGTVIINQGDRESLQIEAEGNVLPQISTKVEDHALKIDFRTTSLRTTKPIIFHLTVKDLKALDFAGSANVQATNLNTKQLELTFSGSGTGKLDGLHADDLKTSINGAGKVTASGTTTTQELHMTGAGEYLAGDLQSKRAMIDVSGAGKATVRASDDLNVQVSGAGSVGYYGNPHVTQNIAGVGKVTKLGDS
jgi:hypothetical protein